MDRKYWKSHPKSVHRNIRENLCIWKSGHGMERAVRCYQKAGFVIDGDVIEQETYIGHSTFYRMIKKNI